MSGGPAFWAQKHPPSRTPHFYATVTIQQGLKPIGIPRPYSSTMDWKTLLSTFGAVFVAELGDKTQLATLSMSAGSRAKWSVFAGSALALVATSAIAVLAGTAVTRYVSPMWLRRIAGGVFIVLGVLFLVRPGD